MVLWLRLHVFTAGGVGSIGVRELTSHMLCDVAKKKKKKRERSSKLVHYFTRLKKKREREY